MTAVSEDNSPNQALLVMHFVHFLSSATNFNCTLQIEQLRQRLEHTEAERGRAEALRKGAEAHSREVDSLWAREKEQWNTERQRMKVCGCPCSAASPESQNH